MEAALLDWIGQYGYFAIFGLLVLGIVGLPVPDETLLCYCGYLVYRKTLLPLPTFLAAFGGSACGITCSYLLGRTLGLGVIHRYGRWLHVDEKAIRRVHDWFDRIGHWILFVGYYIPGVRHFSAVVAGASEVDPGSFALYAYSGALVWVVTFLGIGYALGERWRAVVDALRRDIGFASAAAGLVLACYLLWRYARKTTRR